ncbi:MAG TPA: hypothetical protein VL326_11315 [Kofleriaceae bacterium]|jgi:uncharacterized protein YbjT (DUF2867 family)|nr:hypothetical protein [Kofleriaceae bacterium]
MDVVVIGGSGGLGRLICEELKAKGHTSTVIGRRNIGDLDRVRAPLMINCAGASVALGLGHGLRGYRAVDVPIGMRAIAAAKRASARLVYVGVSHPPGLRDYAYVDAHERVAAAMRDIDGCVVRATGFMSAYAALLPIAKRGLIGDIGNGQARTNPICERDLAGIVVDVALGGDGPRDVAAGGPEVLTRRDIIEAVVARARRNVRIVRVPVWMAWMGAWYVRAFHPRIGQFMQFAVGLAELDAIAPALGTTRFAEYLDGITVRAAAA